MYLDGHWYNTSPERSVQGKFVMELDAKAEPPERPEQLL